MAPGAFESEFSDTRRQQDLGRKARVTWVEASLLPQEPTLINQTEFLSNWFDSMDILNFGPDIIALTREKFQYQSHCDPSQQGRSTSDTTRYLDTFLEDLAETGDANIKGQRPLLGFARKLYPLQPGSQISCFSTVYSTVELVTTACWAGSALQEIAVKAPLRARACYREIYARISHQHDL
ncbi:hypothetical protein B0H19DRAFT_1079208 [Mycena capillaripes]|nr:hypothetical protein B0H19DRAFT_1079208 [Mycena capillaripes]